MCLSIHQGSFEGCGCVTRRRDGSTLSSPPSPLSLLSCFPLRPLLFPFNPFECSLLLLLLLLPSTIRREIATRFFRKAKANLRRSPNRIPKNLERGFSPFHIIRGHAENFSRRIEISRREKRASRSDWSDSPRNLDLDGYNWKSIFHPSSRWIVAIICSNNRGEGRWSFFGPVSFSRCYEVIHGRKIRREMAMHACLYFAFKESSDPRYYAF